MFIIFLWKFWILVIEVGIYLGFRFLSINFLEIIRVEKISLERYVVKYILCIIF